VREPGIVPFAWDACSLMNRSLSSQQPGKPTKQKLKMASRDPPLNNFMMSETLRPTATIMQACSSCYEDRASAASLSAFVVLDRILS
jgi:hypothetical protein